MIADLEPYAEYGDFGRAALRVVATAVVVPRATPAVCAGHAMYCTA